MVESAVGTEASEDMEQTPAEASASSEPMAADSPQALFSQGGKPGGKPSGKRKERLQVIRPGYWVTLGRASDVIPDHLEGHMAAVLSAPYTVAPDPDSGRPYEEQAEDVELVVETRDEFNAQLVVGRDDVSAIHTNGKPGRP
jgi:hypothetical protein